MSPISRGRHARRKPPTQKVRARVARASLPTHARIQLPPVESVAALIHAAWMDTKHTQGVTSRLSESGEELMVPYAQLSEPMKDLDRNSVLAVYQALTALHGIEPGSPAPPVLQGM